MNLHFEVPEVEGGGRVEMDETEMQEDEANQSERRIRKKKKKKRSDLLL